MKYFVLVLFALLLCTPVFAGDKSETAIPTTDIEKIPADLSKVFDAVKAKKIKGETAFCPAFISVEFATRATFKANYGGRIDPKVQVTVLLKGVSDSIMQEIANKAYEYYCQTLTANGYTAIPLSEIKNVETYKVMIEKSDPRGKEEKLTFAPRYTTHAKTFTFDNAPIYSISFGFKWYKLITSFKKGIINHKFTVNFANFSTEKGFSSSWGDNTKSIEIAAVPLISIGSNSLWWRGDGDGGGLNNLTEWSTHAPFVLSTEKTGDGVYTMTVDPNVYKESCLQLIKKNIELSAEYYKKLSQ